MRFGLGLAAFLVIAQIPPHYLRIFTPWMYLLGIGLLLVVAVEGQIGKGAQRWLDLGLRQVPAVGAPEARGADDVRVVHARAALAADVPAGRGHGAHRA